MSNKEILEYLYKLRDVVSDLGYHSYDTDVVEYHTALVKFFTLLGEGIQNEIEAIDDE